MGSRNIITKILTLLAVVISISFIGTKTYAKSPSVSPEKIIELTNVERAKVGVPALAYNDKLTFAAQNKAEDMIKDKYWAHDSPDGLTPWHFISASGYKYYNAGENLAKGYNSSENIITGWMNSEKHRENLLSGGFKDVGVAVVEGHVDGQSFILVVQMFGEELKSGNTFVHVLSQMLGFINTAPVKFI